MPSPPVGSGKTTLMHLLGCLDAPASGELWIEEQDISCYSPNQRADLRNQKIGFVFQNFHLLDDLDAVENVLLPQLYGGVSETKGRQKACELLTLVGLGDRLHHYPQQLAGGGDGRPLPAPWRWILQFYSLTNPQATSTPKTPRWLSISFSVSIKSAKPPLFSSRTRKNWLNEPRVVSKCKMAIWFPTSSENNWR